MCVFAHWDWRHTHNLLERQEHKHCESWKTPILAAIKRSISIVLKLAFSLRFSHWYVPLFLSLCFFHLCYIARLLRIAASPNHHSILDLHFCRFVLSSCIFFSFLLLLLYVLFAADNDNSVSVISFHFKQTAVALAKKIKVKWLVNATQWILKSVLNVVLFQRNEENKKNIQLKNNRKENSIEFREERKNEKKNKT